MENSLKRRIFFLCGKIHSDSAIINFPLNYFGSSAEITTFAPVLWTNSLNAIDSHGIKRVYPLSSFKPKSGKIPHFLVILNLYLKSHNGDDVAQEIYHENKKITFPCIRFFSEFVGDGL